jgi:16S rRNA (adenine1518-N6/adenine1519-N6)-dimethyltransferase
VVPDKRKDQHFLINDAILKRIVDLAEIVADEDVLEIGSGPGNLTRELSKKARHVYSIEMDERLVKTLNEEFKGSNVTIIHGNALKVDFPRFDKVVANLPYSISSDITFKLLRYPFKMGILMYQKEFAKRMIAKTGEDDYSRLSVHVQHYADVKIIMRVKKGSFIPPPEVESAVVRITPRTAAYSLKDEKMFMDLVTAAFVQRRKTMKNAILKGGHIMGIKDPKAIMTNLPQDILEKRAENVSPEQFAGLSNLIVEAIHGNKDLQGQAV